MRIQVRVKNFLVNLKIHYVQANYDGFKIRSFIKLGDGEEEGLVTFNYVSSTKINY